VIDGDNEMGDRCFMELEAYSPLIDNYMHCPYLSQQTPIKTA